MLGTPTASRRRPLIARSSPHFYDHIMPTHRMDVNVDYEAIHFNPHGCDTSSPIEDLVDESGARGRVSSIFDDSTASESSDGTCVHHASLDLDQTQDLFAFSFGSTSGSDSISVSVLDAPLDSNFITDSTPPSRSRTHSQVTSTPNRLKTATALVAALDKSDQDPNAVLNAISVAATYFDEGSKAEATQLALAVERYIHNRLQGIKDEKEGTDRNYKAAATAATRGTESSLTTSSSNNAGTVSREETEILLLHHMVAIRKIVFISWVPTPSVPMLEYWDLHQRIVEGQCPVALQYT